MKYVNNHIYSLHTDSKDNRPLNGVLQGVKALQGTDKAKVFCHFVPINRSSWYNYYLKTLDKIKEGKDIRRNNFLVKGLEFTIDILKEFIDIFGTKKYEQKINEETRIRAKYLLDDMSRATVRKESKNILDTRIFVIAESKDTKKANSICRSFADGFHELNEDNELVASEIKSHRIKSNIMNSINSKKTPNTTPNKMSVEECGKLIQLPGEELQEEFKQICTIKTREIDIPKELQKGNIELGIVKYKGFEYKTYWNNNYNVLSLPKVIIGSMGSGKTTYITKFAIQAVKKGDGIVIFDYVKNCELSEDIKKGIEDKNRIVELNLDDLSNPILLTYNEIEFSLNANIRLENASTQANLIEILIDSLGNENTEPLSSRMRRYLYSACMVAFMYQDSTLDTVIRILTDYKTREKYIKNSLGEGLFKEDDPEIENLRNLNKCDKEGNISETQDSKIEGIIDRIDVLNRNIYMKAMLNGTRKINFVELFNKNKVVIIKMPQRKFPANHIKDALVTFFLNKIWLAKLIQGDTADKPNMIHVITDEIHQVPTAARFISEKITEVRKFGLDMVFTVHYLKQFKSLLEGIKSSGVSYMLLAGTEEENIKMLEKEMTPFTIEDVLRLKKFHSLNIIRGNDKSICFISDNTTRG